MSVTWGLDLSMTAVRLMRREGDVWREDASEPLGGDDMDTRLKALAERLDPPADVDIFLPRDQILYTEIEIADLSNARAEIETAMDGRTPYALTELRLDWDIDDDGTAQIAAIARETLEEAATFVRDLGLKPATFGALAEPSDFRRNPNFGRLDTPVPPPLILTEDHTPAPTFVSARAVSEPGARAESAPVVHVDDATPVVTLDTPAAAPLDPGIPVDLPNGPPRIRTDVGAYAARGRAQSLTGHAPVRVRQRDRALPTPLLAGVAAMLCLGIAAIIWSIFPNSTGPIPQPPEQAEALSEDTTGAIAAPPRDTEVSSVEPGPSETPPEDEIEPELSDTPPEATVTDLALAAPDTGLPPDLPSQQVAPSRAEPVALDTAAGAQTPDMPPTLAEPRDARPEALVAIEERAPEPFRLAALPATPDTPSTSTPGPVDYPGAAITTPISEPATPDSSVAVSVSAPPERLEAEQTVVAEAATDPASEASDETAEVAEALAPEAENDAPTEDVALSEPAAAAVTEQLAALAPTAEIEAEAPAGDAASQPQAGVPEINTPDSEGAPSETVPSLVPTELARSVPDTAPRERPGGFGERAERARYNGYTLAELAELNPPDRPSSEQVEALLALASRNASELAVATSLAPRRKPDDFDSIVASAQVQQQADRRAAAIASNTPDTSAAIEAALAEELEDEEATSPRNSPRLAIPSSASVARQATLDDAIRLNRINLIGVYGSPSDRRALIRLSSGRYVKVKVGDRIDGGTVSAISSSQVQYRKGSRTLSLSIPEG